MRRRAACGLVLSLDLPAAAADNGSTAWLDNERKFKSGDPQYHMMNNTGIREALGRMAAK
jgi:hypothetical protein